jgi:hypothetical protein
VILERPKAARNRSTVRVDAASLGAHVTRQRAGSVGDRVHRLVDPQPGRRRPVLPVPDDICFRYHPDARAEPVLVAYRITTTRQPGVPRLAPAASEGHDSWVDLRRRHRRRLRSAVLVIRDGAAWLLIDFEHAFPTALRPPATCSPTSQSAPRRRSRPHSRRSPRHQAARRPRSTRPATSAPIPATMVCLTPTLPELRMHLRFPPEHWQRIRHPNLVERTFGQTIGEPRLSVGSPAKGPASGCSGRSRTAPAVCGEDSPARRRRPACSKTSRPAFTPPADPPAHPVTIVA